MKQFIEIVNDFGEIELINPTMINCVVKHNEGCQIIVNQNWIRYTTLTIDEVHERIRQALGE